MWVAALKKGRAMAKPVLKPAMAKLRHLRDHGVGKMRTQKKGMMGTVRQMDRWRFPVEKDGYLFPAIRSDCHTRYINKNTVCRAISRIRSSFEPPKNLFVQPKTIRSHSGRHRMVNDLKRCGVADGTAMHFARIVGRRTFLGYGALDDTQAGQMLGNNAKLNKTMSEIYGKGPSKKKRR